MPKETIDISNMSADEMFEEVSGEEVNNDKVEQSIKETGKKVGVGRV